MYRSLALLALNRPAEALHLLQSQRTTEPENLQCLLALSRTQEAAEAKATLDFWPPGWRPIRPNPCLSGPLERTEPLNERCRKRRSWSNAGLTALISGTSRAQLLRMLSRFEASIQAYDRAIALDPDYALAWVFKAEMQRTLGQPLIEAAQRAVELSPQGSHALAYLCQAYFFAGDYEKAIETGKRAVALRPDEQEAWHFVGLSYLRMRADGTDGLDSINARAGLAAERHYLEEAIKAFQGLLNFNPRDCRSGYPDGNRWLPSGATRWPARPLASPRILPPSDCPRTGRAHDLYSPHSGPRGCPRRPCCGTARRARVPGQRPD